MNIICAYRRLVFGRIEVFAKRGPIETLLFKQNNTIVNSAADILALAVSGDTAINGMYLAYTNGVVAEAPVPVERAASHYHTLGSISPKGFVRVPTVSEPAFSSTNTTLYNGNAVKFVAISDANVVIADPGNDVTDGLSTFYGAGLMVLDPDGYVNDLLFAAVNFDIPQLKVAGANIGVRWTLTFANPEVSSSLSSSSSM
jgi:hypothetical protein